MRLHVPAFAHTQVTSAYSWCAYTQKVRRFCDMMTDNGHEVILYAGPENEARVTEHVVVTEGGHNPEMQTDAPSWDANHPFWRDINTATIREAAKRSESGDFLCIIAGHAQNPIAQALPHLVPVEYGIGYEGTCSNFRVFESYAWMHGIYATQQGGAYKSDGRFYDCVIPNSWHDDEFTQGNGEGGYLLYVGRLVSRKGIEVVCATAERAGMPLLLAGAGDTSLITYGEHIGMVSPEERNKLMGAAVATFVPTLYVEPFGGVAVESMLTGTPVITTDWGAFTETVQPGENGWRCRDLGHFEWAAHHAAELDRTQIRKRALARYSTNVVRHQYEAYFQRLMDLRGPGWYREEHPPTGIGGL